MDPVQIVTKNWHAVIIGTQRSLPAYPGPGNAAGTSWQLFIHGITSKKSDWCRLEVQIEYFDRSRAVCQKLAREAKNWHIQEKIEKVEKFKILEFTSD